MKRDPLDRYYTRPHVARAIVGWLDIPKGATVIEPNVGRGAWARALRDSGHHGPIIGVDLDPQPEAFEVCTEVITGDWLTVSATIGRAWIVLGNPPFITAADHLVASLEVAPRVGFLLRSSFVEPAENRRDMWRTSQPLMEWTIADRQRFEIHPDLLAELNAERVAEGKAPLVLKDGALPGVDSVLHTFLMFGEHVTQGFRERRGWYREVVSIERGEVPWAAPPWATSWLPCPRSEVSTCAA